MMRLFECVRLSAKISRQSCKSNKQRGVFACEGCPGLGAATDIDMEVMEMAQAICKVTGCKKLSQHNTDGMCKAHFNGANPRKVEALKPWALPVVPVEVVPLNEIADEPGRQQQITPAVDSFGTVINAEGDQVPFGTDAVVVLALREAWQRKEIDWLAELSGLKPGATISRACQMVSAVEALGY
jgi:hypothetical protein